MKLADLFEDEDDWEAEVASEPWRSFKVQPREGTDGWGSFKVAADIFDAAFGRGNWGQSGIPSKGTFAPMKVSISPGTKINYAILRDNGLKIVFLEGEELEHRKIHLKVDMPTRIHLDKSFYMVRHEGKPFMTYDVKQFLDDQNIAAVYVMDIGQNSAWSFKPNTSRFKDASDRDNEVGVSRGQLYNALKLKWWVTNRLIGLGLLPPKTVKEERGNFGFRPEYRQFWFEISDEDLFFRQQHEHELIHNGTRTTYPDATFISHVINKHVMKLKPGVHTQYPATVVRVGALKGSNPATDPMLFMYDPAIASPSVKVMKEYGLKPRFMELNDAS